jgi:hypothetical protein
MSPRDLSALRRSSRSTPYLAALAAAVLLTTAGAQAATVNFSATIDGPQEPTPSTAVWNGTFVMDTVANTLSINVVDSGGPALTSAEIAAHIHGFAPPGTPAGILFGLPLGSPKNAVWNFLEAQEPSIIGGLTYVNIHTINFPAGEIRGQILPDPECGAAPQGGTCRTALKSILILKDDTSDDAKDKLIYKWIKGQATDQDDFGMPTGTTNYALCLYAGTTQTLIAEANVLADSTKWAPISTKGYKYKDKDGTSDSIQKVILKGGDPDKAKALVKGKGAGLPDPVLGNVPLPVVAELVNSSNNICFGSTFDSPDIIKNDVQMFKAKAQ